MLINDADFLLQDADFQLQWLSSTPDLGFGGGLLASALELLMAGHNHDLRLLRAIAELEQHLGGLEHCCVPATHWVYHLQALQVASGRGQGWARVGSSGARVGSNGVNTRYKLDV